MDSGVYNPAIPYVAPIPGHLQPGLIIRIQGTPSSSATCFSINLQNGPSIDRRNDVALHLSPVFSPPPRLVRNSIQNQQWGPEESHGSYFPFSPGQSFEIMIMVQSDHFKIAVNGQHFAEFDHRLPFATITHLSIDGDVAIGSIRYENTTGSVSPISETVKGDVSRPIGFLTPNVNPGGIPSPEYGRPPSPYGVPTYGMPSANLGQNPYDPPPYNQPSFPPPPPPGYPSPVHSPTYPTAGLPPNYPQQSPTSGYGPQYPAQHYPPPPGGYPTQGSYPGAGPYPTHPGPYPGTSVVYPVSDGSWSYPAPQPYYAQPYYDPYQGSEKDKSGGGVSSLMGPLAAGAAALAGSGLLSGKHGKHGKHGHGGPTSFIADGAAALLGGGGKHGHHSSKSSPIPIGGAVAGGAAALAGAYMLSKTPVGHFFK